MLLNSKIIRTQMIAVSLFAICNGAFAGDKLDNKDNELLKAAFTGKTAEVKKLLDLNANIETRDDDKKTPIIIASEEGHELTVRLLVDSKAELDKQDNYGYTALYASVRRHPSIARLLLDSKACPDKQGNNKFTALINASLEGNEDLIGLLLEHKADTGIKDETGKTAIIWASTRDRFNVCKLLLDAGADPRVRDIFGKNALDWVFMKESVPMDSKGMNDSSEENNKGENHGVVKKKMRELIAILNDKADTGVEDGAGKTANNWACIRDRVTDACSLLLGAGADPLVRATRRKIHELIANKIRLLDSADSASADI